MSDKSRKNQKLVESYFKYATTCREYNQPVLSFKVFKQYNDAVLKDVKDVVMEITQQTS